MASSFRRFDSLLILHGNAPSLCLPNDKGVGSFHYGDPPPHCCPSGATMNSVPRAVLEFWRRDGEGVRWHRDQTHEVEWPEESNAWGGGEPIILTGCSLRSTDHKM